MVRRRLGTIGVVAGVVLLWASWGYLRSQPGEAPGGRGPARGEPERPPSPFAIADGDPLPGAPPESAATGEAGAPLLALGGKVFRSGGPAAGAEVAYGGLRVVSGADGSFALSAPCAPKLGLVARQGPLVSVVRAFDCDEPPSYPGLVLVLRGASTVRGEVRDEEGRPLRAEAELWPPGAPKAATDAQGRFLFAQVPADDYELHVEAEGYRSRTLPRVLAAAGETATVLVELRREATISGKVVDAAGAPLAGAEVGADVMGPGKARVEACVTDAAGAFVLRAREGTPYVVEASARGWAPRTQLTQAPAAGLVLALSRGGEVGGVVRDRAGAPIAGVTLTLKQDLRDSSAVESDGEGRYAFENVAAGAHRLTAAKEGFVAPKPAELEVADEAFTAHDVVLAPADGALAGRVLDAATGEALPGADVECDGRRAKAGAEGRFRLAGLRPGRREACASADGRLEACKTFQTGEGEAVLELAPGRVVRGRVLEEPGVPLGGFFVDEDWVDAADGAFRVLRPLTVRQVEFHCFGRRKATRDLAAAAGAEVDLGDVVLPAGWPVTFRVRTPEGSPAPGASVWGLGEDGWLPELVAEGEAQLVGVADGAGELRAVLDDGRHCYRASSRGWASSPTEGNVHQFKGPATVDLVLRRPARVSGRVLEGGVPQKAQAMVIDHAPEATFTDEAGRYEFPSLEPGRLHVVWARLEGGLEANAKVVEVKPGDDKVVDFGAADRATLVGALACPGAVQVFVGAVPGVFDLLKLDGKPPTDEFTGKVVALVQGRGAYELNDLRTGTATVVVGWSKTDKSRRQTAVVELRPGERKRLDLACEAR